MAERETADLQATPEPETVTEDQTVGCSLEEELEDTVPRHHPEDMPLLDNRNSDFKTQVESLSHLNPAIIEDNLDDEVGSPLTTADITSPNEINYTPLTGTTVGLPPEDFSATVRNIEDARRRRPSSSSRNKPTETSSSTITPQRKAPSYSRSKPVLASRHRDMNESPRMNNLLDRHVKPTTTKNLPTTTDPIIKSTRGNTDRNNELRPTLNPERDILPLTTLSTLGPSEGPLRSTTPSLMRNSNPRESHRYRYDDLVGSKPESIITQPSGTPPGDDDFIDLKTYADNLRRSMSDLIPSYATDPSSDVQSLARSNSILPTRKSNNRGSIESATPSSYSTPRSSTPSYRIVDELLSSNRPSGSRVRPVSRMRDPETERDNWKHLIGSKEPEKTTFQPARSSDNDFVDLKNYMNRLESIPDFLLEDTEEAVRELSNIGRQNSNDDRTRQNQKVTIKDDDLLVDEDGIVPLTHDTDLTGMDIIDMGSPEYPNSLETPVGNVGNRNSNTGVREWPVDDVKPSTFPTKVRESEPIDEKPSISNLKKTLQELAARRNDRKHKLRIPQRPNASQSEEATDKTMDRKPFLSSRRGHHTRNKFSSEEETSTDEEYQLPGTIDETTRDIPSPNSRRENEVLDDFSPEKDQSLGQKMQTFTTDNPVIEVHVHQIPVEVVTDVSDITNGHQNEAGDDAIVGAAQGDEDESEVLTNFGKVIPASEGTEINTTVPENNIFFIGNGIKLPLKMNRKDDGSLQLSVDTDKLCSCRNETCSKTHPFSNSQEQKLLDTHTFTDSEEQRFLRIVGKNDQELNTGDDRMMNRPKRALQNEKLNAQLQDGANNIEKEEIQSFSDEKYDALSHIEGAYPFTKIFSENEENDNSKQSNEIIKSGQDNKQKTEGYEIKDQIVLVRDILKWMKNLAASYSSV